MALTENQKKFLDSLEQHLGVIAKAAHAVNMTRQNHWVWMNTAHNKEEYKKAFDEVNENIDDLIEDELLQRMLESDQVLLFVAKSRLNKRGYVEKQEVKTDLNVNNGFNINLEITKDVRNKD